MLYFKNSAAAAKIAFTAVALVCGLLTTAGATGAQSAGSNVRVMVCPHPGASGFTITSPQSDTVVTKPQVLLAGTLTNISQINVYIDEEYNNTVAFGSSDTTYETEVTLEPGTHTIKVVAHDSCQQTSHTNSVVVTYAPGSVAPTSTDSGGTTAQTYGQDASLNTVGLTPVSPQPFPDNVITGFRNVADALDLGPSEASAGVVVTDSIKSLLVLAVVAVLAFPAIAITGINRFYARTHPQPVTRTRRSSRARIKEFFANTVAHRWHIRLFSIGILMLLVVAP